MPVERKILGSWKEIAAYLGKGVRTVQRWENDLGLPVRRPKGAAKGVVHASADELDRWLARHWAKRVAPGKENGVHKDLDSALEAARQLRRSNQQLLEELFANLQGLKEQCASLKEALKQEKQARKPLTRQK